MATVIFIKEGRQNTSAMRAVINYCQQEYKTYDSKSKRKLVSGINCDGENSFSEFMATKKVHGKDNGVFFYQYVQSFLPTEKITPEQAHEIALEFAEKVRSGHEVLVTTHCDARHIHSHFVINSVGFESGKKLRQSPSTLNHLRKLSDEICIAHGFSVLQPYQGGRKSMSSREYRTRLRGNSWKEKLAKDIGTAMSCSGSKDEFIRNMSILGYHMTWTNERKYLTFHCPNGKNCRDIKLQDEKYLKENIELELRQREFPAGAEQPTGWEDSRKLYEQHLKERAQSKTETQRIADSYSNVGNEISSFTGAVSKIVDNDTEDPDERRKRIEAEENGSTLGTIIGLGIGAGKSKACKWTRLFEYALDNEMIDCRNPFQRKRKRIPKNAPVHQRTPIEDTHKELILRVYHQAQVAAVIMLYCGLRRGELIALEWSDIDLIGKQIAVIKSAERINSNAFTVTAHTKNGKDRYIPIPDNIIPFLKLERFNSCGKTLVCSQKCGKMHTESSWKRMWDSYQSRLNYQHYCDTMRQLGRTPQGYTSPTGIPQILDRFTAHQLRHTYCTMLYHAGVDLKSASQLMGHSDITITLKIYTHLDERFKKINIDKFNRYIANDKTNQVFSLAQVL